MTKGNEYLTARITGSAHAPCSMTLPDSLELNGSIIGYRTGIRDPIPLTMTGENPHVSITPRQLTDPTSGVYFDEINVTLLIISDSTGFDPTNIKTGDQLFLTGVSPDATEGLGSSNMTRYVNVSVKRAHLPRVFRPTKTHKIPKARWQQHVGKRDVTI